MTTDVGNKKWKKTFLILLLLTGCVVGSLNNGKKRVAIVGGGIAGLGAAYCLDSSSECCDVTLFERRSDVGGNAHNTFVKLSDGNVVPADDVFNVFWPQRYPHFTALLKILVVDFERMGFSQSLWSLQANEGLKMTSIRNFRVSSPKMMKNLLTLRSVRNSIRIDAPQIPTDMDLGEYISKNLAVPDDFIKDIFYPLLGQIYYAGDLALVSEYPAKMIGESLHDWVTYQHTTLRIPGGCTMYVKKLVKSMKTVKLLRGTGVKRLYPCKDGSSMWILEDDEGKVYEFDKVVLACTPDVSSELIEPTDPALSKVLASFDIVNGTCVVHSDASLMPKNRNYWSYYNYLVAPGMKACIGTVWSGMRYGKAPVFTTIDFSSVVDPSLIKNVHSVGHFKAVRPNPSLLKARNDLKHYQGRNGLYFAGAWMLNTPSHEHALVSGLNAAKLISPTSPRLLELIQAGKEEREDAEKPSRKVLSTRGRLMRGGKLFGVNKRQVEV